MAGKSNKGRNRKGSSSSAASASNTTESGGSSDISVKDNVNAASSTGVVANGVLTEESAITKSEGEDTCATTLTSQPKQGELILYHVPIKTLSGEKLELQLNPGDSVMDIRQFLLDARETCFITCYDLVLHTDDGSTHHLEDYNEISEVADITTGGCSLEMVAAFYDDRSIRAHIHRTRELLSLSTLHASLSTSLALQYESSLIKNPTSDVIKAEVPELDGLGFMEDVSGSLGKLLSSFSKEVKSVESIVFSSFNPPPSYRRLSGDLIYLDVVTMEGNTYCITGSTQMFYVNSSTTNVFDPRPSKAISEATSLVGLLQKLSPKFKKAFREIMENKASSHPFENVQTLLPPNTWLGVYPLPDHKRDAARAEDALTLSYSSELLGMQRDWNEEVQSCREFPHTTPQERILRDRALYKVTSDFVDAAMNGAIGVISRCIPPINPTDPECFHMYVHNNIFFSFALDGDLEQLSNRHASNVNLTSERSCSSLKSSEKASKDLLQDANRYSNGEKIGEATKGENSDLTSQSSAENQVMEGEQATYASANNDLRGTKAFQEADVSGLYNLAMAIIDYRGHRVVAQSVLPGILQGDKSNSLLYGSVDNGKKICWNEDFHNKVLEAAKLLHLKEHTVLDGSGNVLKLAAPVESKGIVGSDDRHYLLDLMRVTPRDANYTGPGSRCCILRPELVTAFLQAEAEKRPKRASKPEEAINAAADSSKVMGVDEKVEPEAAGTTDDINSRKVMKDGNREDVVECTADQVDSSKSFEQLCFNPNVLTEFKLAGSEEEIAADEENVNKASTYLADVVLPKFIHDLCTLEVSPMDGQTLTDALHAHGINVRYIGKIAEGTKNFPHLWDLCSNEIVVRSAKHILKDVLRDTEDHCVGTAISHVFNCLYGNCQAVSVNNIQSKPQKKDQSGKSPRGQTRGKAGAPVRKKKSSYVNVTSETFWCDIREFAKVKYQFGLPEDARSRVKKVSVLRNLCQKVGVSIAACKYDFNIPTPFQTSDILNLQPIVKHSIPVCSDAKTLLETGKVHLAEGMLSEAYPLFSEAFSILQQVTGPMHREVANCCRYLAMVLYHAGDMAGAIVQQHKELIINERCLGLDHPDTAHSYGNMALFYHGLNQTELALRHMSRALLLLSLSSGPDHPDVAATFINVAMMHQDIGKMDTALRYLQEALKKNERLLGEDHIQTAVCYHALAIAFNCMGAFKLSKQHEKKTYDILVKQLGEDDSRTKDSQNWMNTFKIRELQMNAQKQKAGQVLNAASAQKAIDILKANPDLMHAFQAAAAGGSTSSGTPVNSNLNPLTSNENVARGKGVDQRAARAAAEVRKKAAARGINVRPHAGVPVQALPPLSQLMNIINSSSVPDAPENNEKNEPKKEAVADSENNQSVKQQEQAPVGLGKGLASLESKKQKGKTERS